MSDRLAPIVAAAVGLLLAVLVVLGVVLETAVLTAGAAGLLGATILTVQVDSWRRVRAQRNFLRDEIRRAGAGSVALAAPAPPPVQQEDILGAVRLLQAQYTGRLDRMQRSLEEALEQVAAIGQDTEGADHRDGL